MLRSTGRHRRTVTTVCAGPVLAPRLRSTVRGMKKVPHRADAFEPRPLIVVRTTCGCDSCERIMLSALAQKRSDAKHSSPTPLARPHSINLGATCQGRKRARVRRANVVGHRWGMWPGIGVAAGPLLPGAQHINWYRPPTLLKPRSRQPHYRDPGVRPLTIFGASVASLGKPLP